MSVYGTAFEPSQSFAYEIKGNSAVILRCFSRDTKADIPEYLDGYPVTELGAYAFSAHLDEKAFYRGIQTGKIKLYIPELMDGRKYSSEETAGYEITIDLPDAPALAGSLLQEIVMPNTVQWIGKYCFYNCTCLTRVTFSSMLRDLGAGVFTGVHHVNEMTVTADTEGKTQLKQILDELHEEITVTYLDDKGRQAQLVFPEFFEEGVENTPAKIHEIRIHGSGMKYRNCISGRRMDFRQYDSLFAIAGFVESANMTVRLAVGRLRFPLELSAQAKEQYENYVIEQSQEAADLFLQEKDLDSIKWLLELHDTAVGSNKDKKEKLRQYLTETAVKKQFTEAIGFLMRDGRSKERPARKRFEL